MQTLSEPAKYVQQGTKFDNIHLITGAKGTSEVLHTRDS